eukprot:7291296-Pyramimonas_sp.AAC.1
MLGRFAAVVPEQAVHDMARGAQRRIAHEIRRQFEGRPIQRYKWDMFAAIWILQLANPGSLDRDH